MKLMVALRDQMMKAAEVTVLQKEEREFMHRKKEGVLNKKIEKPR
jgi:hypothetical protein